MIYLYLIFLFFGGGLNRGVAPQEGIFKVLSFIYNLFFLATSIYCFGFFIGTAIFILHFCGIFHITATWILGLYVLLNSERIRTTLTFIHMFLLNIVFTPGIIVFFLHSLFLSSYKALAPYLSLDNAIYTAGVILSIFIVKLVFKKKIVAALRAKGILVD